MEPKGLYEGMKQGNKPKNCQVRKKNETRISKMGNNGIENPIRE
jgi:hypothetical protein